MFKLIAGLVAGAVILAPLSPAHADSYRVRSRGIGVTVGTPGFGISIGRPSSFGTVYGRGYRPFRNEVILRSTIDQNYYPGIYNPGIYAPGIYNPGFPSSTVIVAPRARTVIINPNDNYYRSAYCGSVIYGSPIASPIPVDPFTGLACR